MKKLILDILINEKRRIAMNEKIDFLYFFICNELFSKNKYLLEQIPKIGDTFLLYIEYFLIKYFDLINIIPIFKLINE